MANYANLLATIAANIYTNGNNEVTAAMVKTAVDQMVASLGAGYQFMGVATPTSPGTAQTPDYKCFYIASTPGTYTYLGGLVMNNGEVAVLKYDSAWGKQTIMRISQNTSTGHTDITTGNITTAVASTGDINRKMPCCSTGTMVFDNDAKTISIASVILNAGTTLASKALGSINYGYADGGTSMLALLYDTISNTFIIRDYLENDTKSSHVVICIFRVSFDSHEQGGYVYSVRYVAYTPLRYKVISGGKVIDTNVPAGDTGTIVYYYNNLTINNLSKIVYNKITGLQAGWIGVGVQGHAVYGNHLFQLLHGGKIRVYTLAGDNTPTYIDMFDFGGTSHCNNCQFGKELSDTGFPYLYVADTQNSKIEVLKVSEAAVQVVQTIDASAICDYASLAIGDDGALWGYSVRQSDNELWILNVNCPAISAGTNVTLQQSDLIQKFIIENYVYDDRVAQGSKQYGDKFYFVYGGTYNERGILVYNKYTGNVIADIDLSSYLTDEFEDIDFRNGEMLLFVLDNFFYTIDFV